MRADMQKYLIHPIERPVDDSEAKVDLIRSKDNPIMGCFYESCYYRHDYVICDTMYALPYVEFFCFSTWVPRSPWTSAARNSSPTRTA